MFFVFLGPPAEQHNTKLTFFFIIICSDQCLQDLSCVLFLMFYSRGMVKPPSAKNGPNLQRVTMRTVQMGVEKKEKKGKREKKGKKEKRKSEITSISIQFFQFLNIIVNFFTLCAIFDL